MWQALGTRALSEVLVLIAKLHETEPALLTVHVFPMLATLLLRSQEEPQLVPPPFLKSICQTIDMLLRERFRSWADVNMSDDLRQLFEDMAARGKREY